MLFGFIQIELHKERKSHSCIYLNVTAKHLLCLHSISFTPLCFIISHGIHHGINLILSSVENDEIESLDKTPFADFYP